MPGLQKKKTFSTLRVGYDRPTGFKRSKKCMPVSCREVRLRGDNLLLEVGHTKRASHTHRPAPRRSWGEGEPG